MLHANWQPGPPSELGSLPLPLLHLSLPSLQVVRSPSGKGSLEARITWSQDRFPQQSLKEQELPQQGTGKRFIARVEEWSCTLAGGHGVRFGRTSLRGLFHSQEPQDG